MSAQTQTSYLLKKSLNLALSNIWRNKILSLATIFVIATIVFIFNIILAVNFIAQNALNDLNKKVDISLYLKDDITYEETTQLINEIKAIKEIANVSYTSKEDALKRISETHPDIKKTFSKYNLENPLPASLNITTIDPKYHNSLIEFLSQDRYKIYFTNIKSQENDNNSIIVSVSRNLTELNKFTRQITFWLVVIFVIGGSLIVLNALRINIFSRKKEISIMKLVGASNWFIRSPFIIESILYGTLSVILSFIMLFFLSKNISIQGSSLWTYYSEVKFSLIFLVEILLSTLLSVISSYIAVHEHIQKDLLA